MSSSRVFNRVYRLVDLFSGKFSPSSLLPCANKYCILYTSIQCVRGDGVRGHRRTGGPRQIKHPPRSPYPGKFFIWRHLELLTISLIFLRRLKLFTHTSCLFSRQMLHSGLEAFKRRRILPAIRRRQERSRWRGAPRTCTRAPGCSPWCTPVVHTSGYTKLKE